MPLALAMVGALARSRVRQTPKAWEDILTRLQRSDLGTIRQEFPDYPYPDLLRALDVSVRGLEEADQERYLDLYGFPIKEIV